MTVLSRLYPLFLTSFSYLDDVADRFDASEYAVELLLVFDLDRHGKSRRDVFHRRHGRRSDRDALLGDRVTDVRQKMTAVVRDDRKLDRIDRLGVRLVSPIYFDQARSTLRCTCGGRRISKDVPDVTAVFSMHADAVATRDISDDLIARDRITASGKVHEAVLDTRDHDTRVLMCFCRGTLTGDVLFLR